ncbi:MAG: hypothetical protein ABSG09_09165 [Acidimicrobiales bacterium]
MIDSRFVFLAAFLSLIGAYGYLRDTLRGATSPNRVTWGLWGLEGILGFVVEIQQHVGLASVMTLMLGFVPCVVIVASFKNPHSVWKIGRFDVFCGAISLVGLLFWAVVNQPTVALISFVAADQVAALPTVRKSWLAPASESPRVFFMGFLNCGITLLTLRHFTTAGVLFPGCVLVMDLMIGLIIVTRVGERRQPRSLTPATVNLR